jgi:hypothetical protein
MTTASIRHPECRDLAAPCGSTRRRRPASLQRHPRAESDGGRELQRRHRVSWRCEGKRADGQIVTVPSVEPPAGRITNTAVGLDGELIVFVGTAPDLSRPDDCPAPTS